MDMLAQKHIPFRPISQMKLPLPLYAGESPILAVAKKRDSPAL
jgi:hypothetical protein